MVTCHNAALLDRIVEKGKCCGGTVGTTDFQAHFLQDPGNRVAHSGSGSQGEVHNTEGNIQPFACLNTYDLTHTGNTEGGLLDGLGHHIKGLALHTLQGMVDNTGAGNAHIQFHLRLAHTVEGTGHKGVILHRVGKDHQFGTAQAILVCGDLGGFLNDSAHLGYGIHVDTGLGGAHIDAGADALRGLHGFGNRVHQDPVTLGTTLLHQCGETADEVDTAFLCCLVHGDSQGHIGVGIAGIAHNGNGGDRNTLIDDRNTKLPFDLLAYLHQVLRPAGDLVIDPLGASLHILMGAIQQADTHGDGADVQVALVDHVLGG